MVELPRWRRRTPLPPVPALPSRVWWQYQCRLYQRLPRHRKRQCAYVAVLGGGTRVAAVFIVTVRLIVLAWVCVPASPAWVLIAGPFNH